MDLTIFITCIIAYIFNSFYNIYYIKNHFYMFIPCYFIVFNKHYYFLYNILCYILPLLTKSIPIPIKFKLFIIFYYSKIISILIYLWLYYDIILILSKNFYQQMIAPFYLFLSLTYRFNPSFLWKLDINKVFSVAFSFGYLMFFDVLSINTGPKISTVLYHFQKLFIIVLNFFRKIYKLILYFYSLVFSEFNYTSKLTLWKVVRKLCSYLLILVRLYIDSIFIFRANTPKINYISIKYIKLIFVIVLVVFLYLKLLSYKVIITFLDFGIRFLLQFILVFRYYGNALFRMFSLGILGLGIYLFFSWYLLKKKRKLLL